MIEALISLPLLSFFALPMLSSYSTSLNLLFFWMTWSTLVLSHKPLHVEIFGALIVRTIFYILPSLLFLSLDALLPSLAESMKAQGCLALPSRYGGKRMAKFVGLSLWNVILGVMVAAGLEWVAVDLLGVRSLLKVATRLPLPWHMAIDLARALAIRGILQYYIHRDILHNRRYGGILSKYHLAWAHSLRAPLPFSATYDHPLCYLLHSFLPTFLPAALFRMHVLTYQLLLAIVSLEDSFTYSGYNVLPSSIILPGMARRRDLHYLTKGEGNYAPLGVLDWCHGTGCDEGENDVQDDFEEEIEKHDVKRRASDAMNKTGKFLQDAGTKARKRAGGKGRKRSD